LGYQYIVEIDRDSEAGEELRSMASDAESIIGRSGVFDVINNHLASSYPPAFDAYLGGSPILTRRPRPGDRPYRFLFRYFVDDIQKILAKRNPVAVGQGQHFFIQLRNKGKFSFTKQQKKMGATSKGTMTVVGTPGRDSTGLGDIFGGFEASGYVAWKGTNKETGVKQPWIIQLPRKFGKGPKRGKGGDTVFKKARVTDKETGKSYSTIRPFNADPSTKAAWAKFLKTYGEPIYAEDPKRPNLFRVRQKNRGTYYKRK